MRRIGERLQADTQEIIDAMGLPIQAAQFPFLAAIDRAGPLTVGELAQAVGITQPGATRTISHLIEQGYVEMTAPKEDQRRRLVSLTEKGRALVEYSREHVWPRIDAAVRDLCGDFSASLLDELGAVEDGLAEASLARRTQPERSR
jgi:DNA-binding MarR family transcriptional regulator